MRLLLKIFTFSTVCLFAYVAWAVQPDRPLLAELEQKIEATDFNEVENLLNQFDFGSTTWSYSASTQRFSGTLGSPIVYMGSEAKAQFFALCQVDCEVTWSRRVELVPYLGMDRSYNFFAVRADTGKTYALPDHHYWIMYLP